MTTRIGSQALWVKAFCPMGCGETIYARTDGHLVCATDDCVEPLALSKIVHNPETEHIVTLETTTFSIIHPLRERLGDALLDCYLHQYIRENRRQRGYEDIPLHDGKFRVSEDPIKGVFRWEGLKT